MYPVYHPDYYHYDLGTEGHLLVGPLQSIGVDGRLGRLRKVGKLAYRRVGEMAEWLKATVLKTVRGASFS